MKVKAMNNKVIEFDTPDWHDLACRGFFMIFRANEADEPPRPLVLIHDSYDGISLKWRMRTTLVGESILFEVPADLEYDIELLEATLQNEASIIQTE